MQPLKKLAVGWLYYHLSQYGSLTGQPSGPQHYQIAAAYTEPIGLVTVYSTGSSFTSISKISISLGASSTRPPIGSSPLGPAGWLPSPRIPSPLRHSIPSKLPSRWRHWFWVLCFTAERSKCCIS